MRWFFVIGIVICLLGWTLPLNNVAHWIVLIIGFGCIGFAAAAVTLMNKRSETK